MKRSLAAAALMILIAAVACETPKPPAPSPPATPPPAPVVTAGEIRAALGDAPADVAIHAVRVGERAAAKKDLFYRGAGPEERIQVAFLFFVLRDAARTVLVDAGFVNPAKIAEWKVTGYRSPVDGLAALSIRPDQVTDVIVTHRHWDHVGGLGLFPSARVWMPRREFRDARERFAKTDPALDGTLASIEAAGRLRTPGPLERLFPGVVLVRQGAHTREFQYVVLRRADGVFVLAGDEAPLYASVAEDHPSGQTRDAGRSAAVIAVMRELAGGRFERIVPGHDPEVFRRFPEVAPGVVAIAATDRARTP